MVDQLFTSYAFKLDNASPDLQVARTLPERLYDIFNVKDWGAKGDGVTDDTDAINLAIDTAYSPLSRDIQKGKLIFFPPGIYVIGKGGTIQLCLDRSSSSTAIHYVGCGRDVTILRGNYWTGSQMQGSGLAVTNVVAGTGGVCRVFLGPSSQVQRIATSASLPVLIEGVVMTGASPDVSSVNGEWTVGAVDRSFQWIELSTNTGNQSHSTFTGTYSSGGTVFASANGGIPPNGFLVVANFFGSQILQLRDLAIENLSILSTSGAFAAQSGPVEALNCRFKGVLAYYNQALSFGGWLRNCIFECSRPITTADDSSRSPHWDSSNFTNRVVNGSVGVFFSQGNVHSCQVTGFDIGMAMIGQSQNITGCKISRCGIAINTGYGGGNTSGSGNVGGVAQGSPLMPGIYGYNGCLIAGNWIDRCTYGLNLQAQTLASAITGNAVTGDTGPTTPATITSITWSASPNKAGATTQNPHNLPSGDSKLVLVTSDPAWTPGQTGNEIVTCTKTGANTFTYALSSNPGGTGSGTWNYPLEYGVSVGNVNNILFAANALSAVVSTASFTIADEGSAAASGANTVLATRGAYGWVFASPSVRLGGWKFEQCGTATKFPRMLTFAELPPKSTGQGPPFTQWLFTPIEGDEFDVADCAAQGSFAGVVSAGGSNNHYKLRWNGSNWIRVG